MSAAHICGDVIAHHNRLRCRASQRIERDFEELPRGFSEHDGAPAGCVFERCDERSHIKTQAIGRAPITRRPERDQHRGRIRHEEAKCAVEHSKGPSTAEITEDDTPSTRLGIRGERGHARKIGFGRLRYEERGRPARFAPQPFGGGDSWSKDLLVSSRHPEADQLLDERPSRPRCRIGDEGMRNRSCPDPSQCVGCTRHDFLVLVDHAIEIDQQRPQCLHRQSSSQDDRIHEHYADSHPGERAHQIEIDPVPLRAALGPGKPSAVTEPLKVRQGSELIIALDQQSGMGLIEHEAILLCLAGKLQHVRLKPPRCTQTGPCPPPAPSDVCDPRLPCWVTFMPPLLHCCLHEHRPDCECRHEQSHDHSVRGRRRLLG